uniref:SGNH hydrolase-type esterase domain-containing protein n=1 Tax=Arcella intermedia TaxID=1963864 RepID=A0A6B2LJ45_9EUKA
MFGDSLTAFGFHEDGWGLLLTTYLTTKFDVLNRGLSGYNSKTALAFVKQVFEGISSPHLITICFGANDCNIGSCQYVSLEEYNLNMQQIVSSLREMYPNTHLVLITPPALDNSKDIDGRTNEIAEKYANVVKTIAQERNLKCIDLWGEMQKEEKWTDFLLDGLHLSREGNKFLFLKFQSPWKELCGDIQEIPRPFPNWRALLK